MHQLLAVRLGDFNSVNYNHGCLRQNTCDTVWFQEKGEKMKEKAWEIDFQLREFL